MEITENDFFFSGLHFLHTLEGICTETYIYIYIYIYNYIINNF